MAFDFLYSDLMVMYILWEEFVGKTVFWMG